MRAANVAPAGRQSGDAPWTSLDFSALYDENVAFVHRAVRRLGIDDAAIEDVIQEIFLVVHRRLPEFRGASSLRTWIYGIAVRVVRLHRRTAVRARLHGVLDATAPSEAEHVADSCARRPDKAAETADAWRLLLRILASLSDDQREVFVLAELEELPVPELAEVLGIKLNTAYSRVRLARAAFEKALAHLGERS
jgi:RNA polymerase sigma-70 factor (ECF subfamily)